MIIIVRIIIILSYRYHIFHSLFLSRALLFVALALREHARSFYGCIVFAASYANNRSSSLLNAKNSSLGFGCVFPFSVS